MSGRKNKKKSSTNSETEVYKGKLEVTRTGMGFVIVAGMERDIMVRPERLGSALDGDEVMVAVVGGGKHSGRMQGEIKEVLGRKQNDFSGTLEVHEHFAFVVPDKKNMAVDIFVPLHLLKEGKDGDRVIVKVVEWSGRSKNPVGEVVSILTHESINEAAMQGILVESGFPLHFPEEVLEESERIPEGIADTELQKRRDLRGTLTLTIDPVDAKDFDDAISFKKLKGGNFEIGVHIADVGHFMQPNTALDKEAYRRATSVYLPDRVLPMLPERLSNGLCSLRPHEDKYTFSAIFEMTKAGKIKEYWLGRTITRSQRRFTYEEVQEIIEGADGDHKDVLLQINKLARILREERFKKGAINFSSQEVRFKLDEKGVPIGIVIKESKEAHQLVEEMMLLANKTVAEHVAKVTIKDKPIPFPYRVHDVPDSEKLKMFTTFAGRYGYKFDLSTPESIAQSFNGMLQLVKGKPEQHVLESLGIRTMSKAVYTTENIGHYGLGFEYYCHFTSPIRRYPDVMVHRVLQEVLDGNIHPAPNMEQQCRHCSDQERRAMESERTANKYKQVEFMVNYVGEDFEAVISGVASFGFWAETVEHKCEGMISISDLMVFDDFQLMEGEYALVGRNTGIRFRMGDRIKVRVVSANLEKRQIDYTILELPEAEQHKARKTSGGAGVQNTQRQAYEKPAQSYFDNKRPQKGNNGFKDRKPFRQQNNTRPEPVETSNDQAAEETAANPIAAAPAATQAPAPEAPQQQEAPKGKKPQKGKKPGNADAIQQQPAQQEAIAPVIMELPQPAKEDKLPGKQAGKQSKSKRPDEIVKTTEEIAPVAPVVETIQPQKDKNKAKGKKEVIANATPTLKPEPIAPTLVVQAAPQKAKTEPKAKRAAVAVEVPAVKPAELVAIPEAAPQAAKTTGEPKKEKNATVTASPITAALPEATPAAIEAKPAKAKSKKAAEVVKPAKVEAATEAVATPQPAVAPKAPAKKKKKTEEQ